MRFYPQDGAIYEHRKTGGRYRVLMTARLERTDETMVVYQSLDGTMPWIRPVPEFGERFEYITNVGDGSDIPTRATSAARQGEG